MARRRLLTEQQRAALLALPDSRDQRLILRYYSFSERDLNLIRRQSRGFHQFAFAVQLCLLRYPERVWGIDEELPDYFLHYISEQIGLHPNVLQAMDPDSDPRRNQFRILTSEYDFRRFDEDAQKQLAAWIYPLALSTDKASVLLIQLTEKMRHEQIIIPALSSLEDFLAPILEQADAETFDTLMGALTSEQREGLDLLLSAQTAGGMSYQAWLESPPGSASVNNFLDLLDRLNFIRQLGLDMSVMQRLNPNRLSQLARATKTRNAWRLREMRDKRELYAMLVAFVLQETRILIDEALKMFLILYQQVFKRAKTVQQESFMHDAKQINLHLNNYVAIGKALISARQSQENPFEAIEAILSWEQFIQSIHEAEAIVRPPSFDFVGEIDNRYSYVRRFSRPLLQAFHYEGYEDALPLLQGIELLREIDEEERETLPDWAPRTFVPKQWKPYLFKDGAIQRRFYELAALERLSEHLRSGDVWVRDSLNFRPLTDFLIPEASWQAMIQQNNLPIAMPLDATDYLRPRHEILHEQLQRVEEGLANKTLPDVELLGERLKLGRTQLDVPKDIKQITKAVYKLLPRIPITDLLLEVDASLHFSRHFTHLQSGDPIDNSTLLCTAILTGAINLGLEKMAIVSHHSSYDKLAWVNDCFIRDDTNAKALAEMVHFQLRNPFASHWGSGTTASSDSQYFPVGETQSTTAHRNPYYGAEPGIGFYTHLSDQYSPFYTQVNSTDGMFLLQRVYATKAPEWLREIPALDTLRRIWIQQYYQDEDDRVKWRMDGQSAPSALMIASPYDTEVRYSTKRGQTWVGYKVHFTETCAADEPHFITHVSTTLATESDIAVVRQIHRDLVRLQLLPKEHLLDTAYIATDLMAESLNNYQIELLGPMRPDTSWQALEADAFGLRSFVIDWEKREVTCPMGKTSSHWKYEKATGKKKIDTIQIQFSRVTCQDCACRERCTRSKLSGRALTIHPSQQEYEMLEAARLYEKTEEFRERYRKRAGVEGTISLAAYALGMRRTPYRGLEKTHFHHLATAAAINLRRVAQWMLHPYHAQTRISHFAALAA